MDIVCFLLSDSLGETEYYITLVVWTKSKEDGFIKQEGVKNNGSPLLSPPKKALFVCVCRFLSKNEKKCRQKSVEKFVNETRTKKTRASNRRRRRRRENERKRVFFSPVVFASSFFLLLFFPSARGKRRSRERHRASRLQRPTPPEVIREEVFSPRAIMPAAKKKPMPTSKVEEKIAAHLEMQRNSSRWGFLKISTQERAYFNAYSGAGATEDDEDPFSLEQFRKNFTIKITENNEATNTLEFEMEGISAAFANAFRRIIISEVPSMAIERVYFDKTRAHMDEIFALVRFGAYFSRSKRV